MVRLVSVEGGSNKFWEGSVEGSALTVRFGKVGSDGQSKTKELASVAAAEAELAKLIKEKTAKGYLPEGGGGAAGDPAKGEPRFLFYGRRVSDWSEGANDGHLYELRFREAPDARAREAIAKASEAALATGPVQPGDRPWLWSGPSALLTVGERKSFDPDARFDQVAVLMQAIHGAAPLAEVVYWNAHTPGTHEWDLETIARQPAPTPGPVYPGLVAPARFGRTSDAALPAPVADDAFEAARRAARSGAVVGEAASQAKEAATGAIALVKCEDAPAQRQATAEQRALFGAEDVVRCGASGRVVVMIRSSGDYYGLAFLDDAGARREINLGVGQPRFRSVAIADDGASVLVVVRSPLSSVWEVSLPGGAARQIFAPPPGTGTIAGACLAGPERVVAISEYALFLVARGDGATVAQLKCEGSNVIAPREGVFIVLTSKVAAYGLVKGKLKALAKFKLDPNSIYRVGRRAFANHGTGTHEFVNLDHAP